MIKKPTTAFLLLAVWLSVLAAGPAQMQQPASVPSSRLIDARQLLGDIKTLAADDMEGRLVGSPGGLKAREYVLRRFKEAGLEPFGDSYLQPFEFTNRRSQKIQGANVIGFLRGKKKPAKYIVVTAHYDHVGIQNGAIFNGADDNASGTAALFALAKYFSQQRPDHSLIFAAVDGEEGGLWGSRKFVEMPPVKKEALVLNVNLDMISRNDANELYAAGAYHYPFMKSYLDEIARTAPVKLLQGHDRPELGEDDWTSQSDHFAFHRAMIPFVYFGVENHPDYHQPTDDFENIDQEFYVRAVETILQAIKKFDANLGRIEKQQQAGGARRKN